MDVEHFKLKLCPLNDRPVGQDGGVAPPPADLNRRQRPTLRNRPLRTSVAAGSDGLETHKAALQNLLQNVPFTVTEGGGGSASTLSTKTKRGGGAGKGTTKGGRGASGGRAKRGGKKEGGDEAGRSTAGFRIRSSGSARVARSGRGGAVKRGSARGNSRTPKGPSMNSESDSSDSEGDGAIVCDGGPTLPTTRATRGNAPGGPQLKQAQQQQPVEQLHGMVQQLLQAQGQTFQEQIRQLQQQIMAAAAPPAPVAALVLPDPHHRKVASTAARPSAPATITSNSSSSNNSKRKVRGVKRTHSEMGICSVAAASKETQSSSSTAMPLPPPGPGQLQSIGASLPAVSSSQPPSLPGNAVTPFGNWPLAQPPPQSALPMQCHSLNQVGALPSMALQGFPSAASTMLQQYEAFSTATQLQHWQRNAYQLEAQCASKDAYIRGYLASQAASAPQFPWSGFRG
jgi:hypothetical protein